MNKQSLRNKISKNLDQLSELLDNIDEARAIDSNDPDTWGEPRVFEEGLCSLVDIYQEDQKDDDYDE